jgi:hypothetical protein
VWALLDVREDLQIQRPARTHPAEERERELHLFDQESILANPAMGEYRCRHPRLAKPFRCRITFESIHTAVSSALRAGAFLLWAIRALRSDPLTRLTPNYELDSAPLLDRTPTLSDPATSLLFVYFYSDALQTPVQYLETIACPPSLKGAFPSLSHRISRLLGFPPNTAYTFATRGNSEHGPIDRFHHDEPSHPFRLLLVTCEADALPKTTHKWRSTSDIPFTLPHWDRAPIRVKCRIAPMTNHHIWHGFSFENLLEFVRQISAGQPSFL